MNRTYFISDTHFGHKKIISSCNRPFKDVEEMNKTLIANWNNVVDDGDTIYHLGDVFGFDKKNNAGFIYSLKGHKILLPGNHDYESPEHYQSIGFEECHHRDEFHEITVESRRIFMRHYPPLPEEVQEGIIYLFGHLHNKIADVEKLFPNRFFCVSVERTGFKPVQLDEIISGKGYEGCDGH